NECQELFVRFEVEPGLGYFAPGGAGEGLKPMNDWDLARRLNACSTPRPDAMRINPPPRLRASVVGFALPITRDPGDHGDFPGNSGKLLTLPRGAFFARRRRGRAGLVPAGRCSGHLPCARSHAEPQPREYAAPRLRIAIGSALPGLGE